MDPDLVPYAPLGPPELAVIDDIARHLVEPSPLQRALELVGTPLDAVLQRLTRADSRIARRVTEVVRSGVERGVERAIRGGGRLMSDEGVVRAYRGAGWRVAGFDEIADLPLEAMDATADGFARTNAALVAGEGVALGVAASVAEAVPGAVLVLPAVIGADVAASMTLLSRHVVQVGAAYGRSVHRDPANFAHVLAAMVPEEHTHDEGFLPVKLWALGASREAGQFVTKLGEQAGRIGFERALGQMGRQAPQLVRLVTAVVERLGLRVSQKVLGLLVPVVGGAVNGGLNLAFQQTGHRAGKDYFRQLVLEERHGAEAVRTALAVAVARRRGAKGEAAPDR